MAHYDWQNLIDFMNRLCEWRSPGCAITVHHHGKEVFRYAAGVSDIESGEPMGCDKLLNIYSCSKVTTAVAAMQLYEKGLFLLDDPLYAYIPEFRHMTVKDGENGVREAKNAITLRHLCSMGAGFDYSYDTPGFRKAYELTNGHMDTVTAAKCMAEDPLTYEPGTRWVYSKGYDILAAFVEVVSSERFEDYVRRHIFEPLGMKAYYHIDEKQLEGMAPQYRYCAEGSEPRPEGRVYEAPGGFILDAGKLNVHERGDRYDNGGAGIKVTVEEYSKLTNALSMGGGDILSPAGVRLMHTNLLTETQLKDFTWSQLRGYGYGVGVRTVLDRATAGFTGKNTEFGWGGAAGASVLVDTDEELSCFFGQHLLNPGEEYYQPRLRNALYSCLK